MVRQSSLEAFTMFFCATGGSKKIFHLLFKQDTEVRKCLSKHDAETYDTWTQE